MWLIPTGERDGKRLPNVCTRLTSSSSRPHLLHRVIVRRFVVTGGNFPNRFQCIAKMHPHAASHTCPIIPAAALGHTPHSILAYSPSIRLRACASPSPSVKASPPPVKANHVRKQNVRVAAFVVLWVILSFLATPVVGALLALSGHRSDGQGSRRGGAPVRGWRLGGKGKSMAGEEPNEPPHTSA